MNKMNKKRFKKTYDVIDAMTDSSADKFDVLGSYTGHSLANEAPTQDADDL